MTNRLTIGAGALVALLCAHSAGAAGGQVAFDQAVKDLASPDANTRLKTVHMLGEARYPEAAVPLAALIIDAQDAVQFAAIAAELNLFLADKVTTQRHVALIVETRHPLSAEEVFSSGPQAIASRPVPREVLSALETAINDNNPRVGLEALYAYGTLASVPTGAVRRDVLSRSAPALAALLGAHAPAERHAAARVIGRVFERRATDGPIDVSLGEAVVAALNDRDRAARIAAIRALGAMRYDHGVQPLTDVFTLQNKGETAEAALDALAHIANPVSAPLFTAQLSSPDPVCREFAVEGLARLTGTAKYTDIEVAMLHERSESVLLAVSFAATMLSNKPIDEMSEALVRVRLRDQARHYLIEIAASRPALFARQVQDPDSRLRLEIAEILALGGGPAALPLVEPLAKDKDPAVARAAERAIARLRATAESSMSAR
jgi:HEAT repeat protein